MAAAWGNELADAGVPDSVSHEIRQTYKSAKIFCFSFKTEERLDDFGKGLLVKCGLLERADDPAGDVHPAIGALRACWAAIYTALRTPMFPPAAPMPPQTNCVSLLPASSTPRLHSGERQKLMDQFLLDYPGATLPDTVLPSVQYLNVIQQQCAQHAFAWIPWRRILSEEQAIRQQERRGSTKMDLLDVVAHAAGLSEDQMEVEVAASPYKLRNLLSVRSHAFAMCGFGHLGCWAEYVDAFMAAYTQLPPEHFRAPSVQEAEEVDRQVLVEVFKKVFKGSSMDDALRVVIREREAFRVRLVCLPRVPKSVAAQPVKLKPKEQNKRARNEDANGECFSRRKGLCKRLDCKFAHACATCGSTEHCAADCPQNKDASEQRPKRRLPTLRKAKVE